MVYRVYIDVMSIELLQIKTMDMRIRNIDPELSRRFRALCTLEGKTLGQYLTELMEKELERLGKL